MKILTVSETDTVTTEKHIAEHLVKIDEICRYSY